MTRSNRNGAYRDGEDRPRRVNGQDRREKNADERAASYRTAGSRTPEGRASHGGTSGGYRSSKEGRTTGSWYASERTRASASGQASGRRVRRSDNRLRKRRRRLYIRRALAAVSALALCAVIWGAVRLVKWIGTAREIEPVADTFHEGVSISGTPVSGMTQDEARAALNARYAGALNAEIVMTFEGQSWSLKPQDIGVSVDVDAQLDRAWQLGREGTPAEQKEAISALKENPVDLDVTLSYDSAALRTLVEGIKAGIDRDPVNATMEIVEIAQFSYTDSSVGYRLDADGLIEQLETMIKEGKSGTIELEPEIVEPEISRESLENKTLLLGECTTTLATSGSKRTSNVNLALSYFNFMTVEPGETVNFNKVVGKRTEENGFKRAPEYAGSTVIEGVGGGVCQASTTIYGAVIRAGLKVVERHQHTMTVGYVQPSQDAAVSDGDKNMRFKNNTESTLYIFAYVDRKKEEAVCKIFGQPVDPNTYIEIESVVLQTDISGKGVSYVKDEEGSHAWYTDEKVLKKEGKPGLRSEAYRVVRNIATGEEISREKLSADSYQPENDTYWVGVHER